MGLGQDSVLHEQVPARNEGARGRGSFVEFRAAQRAVSRLRVLSTFSCSYSLPQSALPGMSRSVPVNVSVPGSTS